MIGQITVALLRTQAQVQRIMGRPKKAESSLGACSLSLLCQDPQRRLGTRQLRNYIAIRHAL